MRFICLIFLSGFLFGYLPAQEKHAYNPPIDVQHYAFAITLNDLNDEIKATAAITVLFLQSTQTISFDLVRKNDRGKGMDVLIVKENEETIGFEQEESQIKLQLSNPAKAGETRTYRLSYAGIPADGLVFSKNKFKQRTIFADNWPNRARNWLPCIDHLSDKASVDFMVTAPDHYKVISNGVLVEESSVEPNKKFTHWRETVALPTKVMVIGLADFAVNDVGNVDGIPVSSWVFQQDRKNGFYEYGQAMEVLLFFMKKVGPYPYRKLANVEAITIFGGMENASAIFYNERSITGKSSSSEELVAHEIAHQWFGNSATESDWPHVWLSEGFATEMTNCYLENKYGADTLKARLKADRTAIIKFTKIRFTPVVDSSEKENYLALLNRNSYEKGGWVLHMLRRKLGDTLFWKGIQTYYAEFAGKNASTDDLRKVMEVVSGMSLKEFFQQWLYSPGHPVLQVKWKYNYKRKLVLLSIRQQQKEIFSFPLELAFKNGAPLKNHNQSYFIKDKITQVEIPMSAKPTRVIADPETNLLFEGSIVEEKAPVP
ncbi:MAG: M1 family metallopeptidase [Ferruginibacter sp.]|nr:M1 family metallopeptidase [Ferruginibacter sp.]